MPAVMTFSSLQTDIQGYLERGQAVDPSVNAQLPSLINLAERNISRAVKLQGAITVVIGQFTSGTAVYAKPTRWRETVSMHYGTGQTRLPIFPRSYEYCRAYWPTQTDGGPPEFYADYNYDNWLFAPTPDQAYAFEFVYYELPALLDSTNATNWLTNYAPELLLSRSLLEVAHYLKDAARVTEFGQMFAEALGSTNTEDLKRIVDRSSTRQMP